MLIRPATHHDAAAVRQLLFEVLAEYGLLAEHQGVDADLDDIEGHYRRRGGLFDVMYDSDDAGSPLIGMVGLFPRDAGVVELRKMYLRKCARDRGLGRLLLDRAVNRARELGFSRIELETSAKLVEAIALYRRNGFREFQPAHVPCRCGQAFFLDLR
jgi:GNAT superfamily N-acetyltransferase